MLTLQVVVNKCYGGFNLSQEGKDLYKKLSGKEFTFNTKRFDSHLIQVVKELGEKANTDTSDLRLTKVIPKYWRIISDDGVEYVEFYDGHLLNEIRSIVFSKQPVHIRQRKVVILFEERDAAKLAFNKLKEDV